MIVSISLLPGWSKAPTADVVYVNPASPPGGEAGSWEDAFNDLQAAIDGSPSDSEFWCASGDLGVVEIGRSARLFGGFAGTEVAREERDWTRNRSVITSLWSSSDVSADGFNFVCPREGAGVVFSGGENPGLSNCRFDGCSSPLETIYFNDCANPFLINCSVLQCQAGQKVPSAVILRFGVGPTQVLENQ